jgi:hypothetical protein
MKCGYGRIRYCDFGGTARLGDPGGRISRNWSAAPAPILRVLTNQKKQAISLLSRRS